jgi:DNA-binding NarL/FixJ family response regulator
VVVGSDDSRSKYAPLSGAHPMGIERWYMTTRILLADDNALVRRLIRQLLTVRHGWEVCAQAANGVEAVDQAKATSPDLAILDIVMPLENGIEAGRKIIELRRTKVLTMSVYEPKIFVRQLMEAGIHGFVSKTSLCSDLIPAIESLLRGESYFRLSNSQNA